MRFSLLVLLIVSFLSCQTKKNVMQIPQLLTAEQSHWYGGVKGVRGANFNLVLKSNSNKEVIFDKLEFKDGTVLSLKQRKEKGFYYLSTSWRAERTEKQLLGENNKVESKSQYVGNEANLYFHIEGTNDINFIMVTFENKSTPIDEEMYP